MYYFLFSFSVYIIILILIGFSYSRGSYKKENYLLGSRELNYWVTAISANTSDMSSWLFIGLPAVAYLEGRLVLWIIVGLTSGMFMSWHFFGPKLRKETEKYNSITLFDYFSKKSQDNSGWVKKISSCLSVFFFIPYISVGIMTFGLISESLFKVDYCIGCYVSALVIVVYVYIGGFFSVAYTEFFQGLFLLAIILFIFYALVFSIITFDMIYYICGSGRIEKVLFKSSFDISTALQISLGWGLGYFGQPHILNKFMATEDRHFIVGYAGHRPLNKFKENQSITQRISRDPEKLEAIAGYSGWMQCKNTENIFGKTFHAMSREIKDKNKLYD